MDSPAPAPRWPGSRARLRVLVAAESTALRTGLRVLIESDPSLEVIGEVPPGGEPANEPFDVLVASLANDAEAALERHGHHYVTVAAVLLADWRALADALPPASAPRAFLDAEAGADELAAAIHAVAAGLTVYDALSGVALLSRVGLPRGAAQPGTALTARELDVLRLLAEGLPNKGIALRLGISEHTAKFHVGSILAKLGVESRTEAVMAGARRGLLPL